MNKSEIMKLINDNPGCFYVYILKKSDNIPFYVGKGKEGRIFDHKVSRKLKNKHLSNILKKYKLINREIVGFYKSENEAFARETELISIYGRINNKTGILCNLTDGGEGPSGMLVDASVKRKMQRGTIKFYKENPQFTKYLSELHNNRYKNNPELKKRISQSVKNHHDNHPETKIKMNISHLRRLAFKSKRENLKKTMSESYRKNPERKEKISKTLRENYEKNPNIKTKISESLKTFYANPENILVNSRSQKLSYKKNPGRAKRHSETMKEHYKSEEARRITSLAGTKRFSDPKEREKQSIANIQRYKNPAERKRTGEAIKKAWGNPDVRKKASDSHKERYKDPLARKKTGNEVKVAFDKRKKIRNECITLIKNNKLDLPLLDGRSSIKTWENFLLKVRSYLKTLNTR